MRLSAPATRRPREPEIGHIRRSAGELADALEFEWTPGELATANDLREPAGEVAPFVKGGEYSYGFDATASLGFNAAYNGHDYCVTAGHCTDDVSHWSSCPGNDYGVVRYDNSTIPRPGTVRCGQNEVDITGSVEPRVGMPFSIAGYNCRTTTVRAVNVSMNYGGVRARRTSSAVNGHPIRSAGFSDHPARSWHRGGVWCGCAQHAAPLGGHWSYGPTQDASLLYLLGR
ncbi:hypothetical protein ACIBBB_29035 [Streptomyces sp. NPDC051217]|uniref:hypothetical protein n=1 Tax=Streptomyces sp. NPDC051217 TaxID=3365644 RepID=UPI003799A492